MKIEILINNNSERGRAASIISCLNVYKPVLLTIKGIGEGEQKKRSLGQNSLQWVSLLTDFSEQVFIDGKKFDVKVWHSYLKEKFLPEFDNGIETLPGYKKYSEMPDGSLRVVGSTTMLTKLGMENYLHQCYAYGDEFNIRFKAK